MEDLCKKRKDQSLRWAASALFFFPRVSECVDVLRFGFLKVGREGIHLLEAEAAQGLGGGHEAKLLWWPLMRLVVILGCICSGQVISAGLTVIDDSVP